eukprot:364180-Chlamydomonas_euryale.AAC.4
MNSCTSSGAASGTALASSPPTSFTSNRPSAVPPDVSAAASRVPRAAWPPWRLTHARKSANTLRFSRGAGAGGAWAAALACGSYQPRITGLPMSVLSIVPGCHAWTRCIGAVSLQMSMRMGSYLRIASIGWHWAGHCMCNSLFSHVSGSSNWHLAAVPGMQPPIASNNLKGHLLCTPIPPRIAGVDDDLPHVAGGSGLKVRHAGCGLLHALPCNGVVHATCEVTCEWVLLAATLFVPARQHAEKKQHCSKQNALNTRVLHAVSVAPGISDPGVGRFALLSPCTRLVGPGCSRPARAAPRGSNRLGPRTRAVSPLGSSAHSVQVVV